MILSDKWRKLGSPQGGRQKNFVRFHYNLKFMATFGSRLRSQDGTIFTVQVQEYMDDGVLMMPSNYRPHYVAMTLAHFGNEVVNTVMERFDYSALYVAQVQAHSKGVVSSVFGSDPFVHYTFDKKDMPPIRDAFDKMARLLFRAGANTVYLPLVGSKPIHSYEELGKVIDDLDHRLLELVSVHAMSSCPMGPGSGSVVSLDGRIHGTNNLFICDASILPSNIGESPQGTIMALAHEIMTRHLSGS